MELHLITEDAFHTSYLLAQWCEAGHAQRGQIVIRSEKPENLADRIAFHAQHAGKTELTVEEMEALKALYLGGLSYSEKAMIARYGIPELPAALLKENVQWIGDNLNEGRAVEWLNEASSEAKDPRFFVFLDKILREPWKAQMEAGHVFNAHSARLPYAAGMYAVENMAAMNDPQKLNLAAGATVHYVNAGIDEGNIVWCEKIPEPLKRCNSIWDLKGASYSLAFTMLTGLATTFHAQGKEFQPKGTKQDMNLRIADHFRAKDFTPEKCREAVANFEAMQQKRGQGSPML